MPRRIMMIALFLAAAAAMAMAVVTVPDTLPADDGEPSREMVVLRPAMPEGESTLPEVVAEFEMISAQVQDMEGMGKDVRVVLRDGPRDDPSERRIVDRMMDGIGRDRFMDDPGQPMGPSMRPMDAPEPRPVNPQGGMSVVVIDLPKATESDLGTVDTEFVQEVINYAVDNGMGDLAQNLSARLLANLASIFKTSNTINSLDTKANGEDDADEQDDFIFVDDTEEDGSDQPPMWADRPMPPASTADAPERPVQSQVLLLIL